MFLNVNVKKKRSDLKYPNVALKSFEEQETELFISNTVCC